MVAGNTGQILTEAGPSVREVLLVIQLFCSSKVNFHLDLDATPSVQATVSPDGNISHSLFYPTILYALHGWTLLLELC